MTPRAWHTATDRVMKLVDQGQISCSCVAGNVARVHDEECNITRAIDRQMDIEQDHIDAMRDDPMEE